MKSVRWGLIALSAAFACASAQAQTTPPAAPAPAPAVAAATPPAAAADAATPAAIVGNPVDGQKKAYTCFGCHGIPNYTNAYPTYRVPKLGGQHPEYIVAALQEYKKGARPHPTMHAQASSMTDQDMADIAAFFSKAPQLQ